MGGMIYCMGEWMNGILGGKWFGAEAARVFGKVYGVCMKEGFRGREARGEE